MNALRVFGLVLACSSVDLSEDTIANGRGNGAAATNVQGT